MRQLGELAWVEEGTVVSARVGVVDVRVEPSFRRRIQRTIAVLEDETGTLEATWFGRRYIERRLHPGDRVVVSGKLKRFGRKLTLDNPDFQPEGNDDEMLHVGRIVPVYRLTAGLTATRLRIAMRDALDRAGKAYPEYLPRPIREGEDLVPIGSALEEAHYPASFEGRDAALRRLAFDELLALQLGMVGRRRQRGRDAARPIPVDDPPDAALRGTLTGVARPEARSATSSSPPTRRRRSRRSARTSPARRRCSASSRATSGRGKTAVAAYALAAAARAGLQGALLAPTDLLARQHHATLASLLEDAAVPVELLTGSLTAAREPQHARARSKSGMAPVVVGTHALIQERVEFAALGVVVIDEQHRFGVEQRGQLEAKAGGHAPHVLLMTATPIPRTLGQVLYADLDVSDLRTPPEGRIPIRTGIRHPDDLGPVWDRVRAEAAAGHRTFVVVPLIDEADAPADDAAPTIFDSSAPAAEAEAVRLRELLAPLRVGMVHGRMKAADRDAEMARFRDGELDVLVGTTVVEVGVDVPGGDDDDHRGGRPVRARPAPPASRPRRPGNGRVVLRPRLRLDRRDRPGAAQGRHRDPRRVRAGRARLRAPARGRRPRPRPVGAAAAAGRVAPGQDPRRARPPRPRARRGAPRRRRRPARRRSGAGPRAPARLARASLGRRSGQRRLSVRRLATIALGLRANAGQFALLVGVQALIGAMVGQERTVLPLMATQIFGLSGVASALTFLVAFGITKALTNLAAGLLADRYGRRPVLIAGWLVGSAGAAAAHLGTELGVGRRRERPARHQPGPDVVGRGDDEGRSRRAPPARTRPRAERGGRLQRGRRHGAR